MAESNISIPMKLDAFVFNQDVCDGDKLQAKIAPITQPNYTFLRIQGDLLQNDLLDAVDLANAAPHDRNARITDLGTGKIRKNRLGVYLHWAIPRPYRSGAAATPETEARHSNLSSAKDPSAPKFRNPPTRWLVLRKIDPDSIQPAGAPIQSLEGWVVESDRVRLLDQIPDSVDLQVDVSPYILSSTSEEDPAQISINKQAEIFVGYKEGAADWKELGAEKTRVDLSLLNSSNQLFPDYQPHNNNVFSVLDRFTYRDENGSQRTLTDAVASYYVLGWHPDSNDDPFTLHGHTRSSRLSELNMTLDHMEEVQAWLDATTNTRVVCHGAMYQVEWHDRWIQGDSPEPKKPERVPADVFTEELVTKMPVAVGTTPMDTLLAYIHANHEDELENDIFRIAALLRAQSDSVTDQQAAETEVQNYNFTTEGGGTHYIMSVDNERPAQPPSAEDQSHLKEINQAQALINSAEHAQTTTQWDMFSLWWKYTTDPDKGTGGIDGEYKLKADGLWSKYETLRGLLEQQHSRRQASLGKLSQEPKTATFPEFNLATDPSVVVVGARAGWPEDFLQNLLCRLDYQIDAFQSPSATEGDDIVKCLPSVLQRTARALLREFLENTPAIVGEELEVVGAAYKTVPPLYHDQGDPSQEQDENAPWRDRWESTQPWFPLFVEWEVEFFHVEYDKWTLDASTSWADKRKKFRHAIKPSDRPLWEDGAVARDTRILAGRSLILPQPAFSLKAQIEQLFNSTSPDILDPILPPEERERLLADVSKMPLLSLPLSGFVNQLTTTLQGNHLKPNIRVPGSAPTPIVEAYEASQSIGLGEPQLAAVGAQTDMTPFGKLVPLPNNGCAAFKPATHGQFRFTKLNIVDKFGQCAPAIDQRPSRTGPPPLYPCLSDYVVPQSFGADNTPNVAVKPENPNSCEFAQVPPQINQASRLNCQFVTPDEDASPAKGGAYWRPAREWDNPIWGWIVVNYVNNGIQFFLPDGTFYREARVASPDNPRPVAAGKRWLPFGQSEEGPVPPGACQIDLLIRQFTNPDGGQMYLEGFIAMITGAVDSIKSSPSAYGQFVNALVGKPLALVNVGYSLELATDAKVNQSQEDNQDGKSTKFQLLPAKPPSSNEVYNFQLKLGDHDRLDDSLVGYFRAHEDPWSRDQPAGNELKLETLYTTYYADNPHFAAIDGANFPQLQAFYANPLEFAASEDPGPAFTRVYNSKMNPTVFGCIVDPFLALHAYTGGGVAPVQALKLPEWTWQTALQRMTAFFHFGPLMVTGDVPGFDDRYVLPGGNYAADLGRLTVPGAALPLPSLKTADWRWLQGYMAQGGDGEGNSEGDDEDPPQKYMALALGKLDATPRYERGPYTAIEGYLQMARPIEGSNNVPHDGSQ